MSDISFIKVCGGLDVNPIVDSLLQNPQLWDENSARRVFKGSPHSQMTDIWVRFGDTSNGDLSVLGREHDSVWYPGATIIVGIKELAFKIMSLVDGERLGGILITKLPAGSSIDPHIDSGWHASYYEKFYVSLRSPEGSKFCFQDGEIISDDGDCYLFRNYRTHWVTNDSDEDRLSAIICIKTDKYKGM